MNISAKIISLFSVIAASCLLCSYKAVNPRIASNMPADINPELSAVFDSAKSGQEIILPPGKVYINYPLMIYDKSNIKIRGQNTELIQKNSGLSILSIHQSTNIEITDIKAYHEPSVTLTDGKCDGTVLAIAMSKNIFLKNLELNGSGRIGLDLNYSKNIWVEDAKIHSNSMYGVRIGGYALEDIANVTIVNSHIYKNAKNFEVGIGRDRTSIPVKQVIRFVDTKIE